MAINLDFYVFEMDNGAHLAYVNSESHFYF